MSTVFDKIWATHVVARNEAGEDLIYIDRHLVHEVPVDVDLSLIHI